MSRRGSFRLLGQNHDEETRRSRDPEAILHRQRRKGCTTAMTQHVTPVQTLVGEIRGRNAIYLDEFAQKGLTLTLNGEINADLCSSAGTKGRWLQYRLMFVGVLAFDSREIETCAWPAVSAFDEVEDSPWLLGMSVQKRAHELRHELELLPLRDYIVSTYDWVYRIAATRFELTLVGDRPKKGSAG